MKTPLQLTLDWSPTRDSKNLPKLEALSYDLQYYLAYSHDNDITKARALYDALCRISTPEGVGERQTLTHPYEWQAPSKVFKLYELPRRIKNLTLELKQISFWRIKKRTTHKERIAKLDTTLTDLLKEWQAHLKVYNWYRPLGMLAEQALKDKLNTLTTVIHHTHDLYLNPQLLHHITTYANTLRNPKERPFTEVTMIQGYKLITDPLLPTLQMALRRVVQGETIAEFFINVPGN